MPDQGTKIPHAETKTQHSQINQSIKISFKISAKFTSKNHLVRVPPAILSTVTALSRMTSQLFLSLCLTSSRFIAQGGSIEFIKPQPSILWGFFAFVHPVSQAEF